MLSNESLKTMVESCVWIGFTFFFFSPVIYFTVRLFIDLVINLFEA